MQHSNFWIQALEFSFDSKRVGHVTCLTCRSGRCGDMDKADVWSDTRVQASERWGRAVLLDCGRLSTREGKIDGIRASEQPRGACRCLSMLPCTVAHTQLSTSPGLHTHTQTTTNIHSINNQHTATCICQRDITWGMCEDWKMNGFLCFLQWCWPFIWVYGSNHITGKKKPKSLCNCNTRSSKL